MSPKANWGVIGHNITVNQLTRALELGRLSHAYLFVGPHHLGKETLARKLAQSVNEQGILVVGFSFPVVPLGEARIRVQLSAIHTQEQIDKAISVFEKSAKELSII